MSPDNIGIALISSPSIDDFQYAWDHGSPIDSISLSEIAKDIASDEIQPTIIVTNERVNDQTISLNTPSHEYNTTESSTKLLYEAFSSLSLADKCALSLSLGHIASNQNMNEESSRVHPSGSTNSPRTGRAILNNDALQYLSLQDPSSSSHEMSNIFTSNQSTIQHSGQHSMLSQYTSGMTSPSPRSDKDTVPEKDFMDNVLNDIQSVISESDKESLDVAMSMMGQQERLQVEDEVRIIQANVRAWLLRKNYINLRESAKVLQGFWRDKKKGMNTNNGMQTTRYSSEIRKRPRQSDDQIDSEGGNSLDTMGSNANASSSLIIRRSPVDKKLVSIQKQKRDEVSNTNRHISSIDRENQAAATLQAATRGMIARKSFSRLRRQAMASLIIQKSCLNWWNRKAADDTKIYSRDCI